MPREAHRYTPCAATRAMPSMHDGHNVRRVCTICSFVLLLSRWQAACLRTDLENKSSASTKASAPAHHDWESIGDRSRNDNTKGKAYSRFNGPKNDNAVAFANATSRRVHEAYSDSKVRAKLSTSESKNGRQYGHNAKACDELSALSACCCWQHAFTTGDRLGGQHKIHKRWDQHLGHFRLGFMHPVKDFVVDYYRTAFRPR